MDESGRYSNISNSTRKSPSGSGSSSPSFMDLPDEMIGMTLEDGQNYILNKLRSTNRILLYPSQYDVDKKPKNQSNKKKSVAVCWRCGTTVYCRATQQWFWSKLSSLSPFINLSLLSTIH